MKMKEFGSRGGVPGAPLRSATDLPLKSSTLVFYVTYFVFNNKEHGIVENRLCARYETFLITLSECSNFVSSSRLVCVVLFFMSRLAHRATAGLM